MTQKLLCICLSLTCLWALALSATAQAEEVETEFYTLNLPDDWTVISGPLEQNGATHLLMGQRDHRSSALIVIGPAMGGEAKKAAEAGCKSLGGKDLKENKGQWTFSFVKDGKKGLSLLREDAQAQKLLLMVLSGDLEKMDFVYALTGKYKALYPVKP